MSVAEIKEQLRLLSPAELKEIEHLLAELRRTDEPPAPRIREVQPDDPDVPAAVDAVFEKHGDLLRRLAE